MASDGLTGSARPQAPHPHFHRRNVEDPSDIAADQDQRFARDIEREVVGPMPVDHFLGTFLSPRTRIRGLESVTFSGVPDRPDKESAIYPSLRDDLNTVLKASNSKLAFYDTSNRTGSPGKVGSSKPGLGMFREDDANKGNLEDSHEPVEGGTPGECVYTACMGQVYMFIEVKTFDDLDFFTDPPDGDAPPEYRFTTDTSRTYSGDRKARYRVSALGQNARYAHVVQTRQFRTCVYSISVAGATARLLRWDRSGVIVTESFNYKTNPEILVGFVLRFSKATNEQRGFDGSAVAVDSEADRKMFVDAIKGHVEEQLPGLDTEDIEEEVDRHVWPGAVTCLIAGAGAEAHNILVSRPMFTTKGPTGRSTRGYWGVDRESDEVVFVKDVWRTDVLGMETEGVISEELIVAGVRNIPGLVCHGYVVHEGDVQTTQTDKFANEPWVESLRQTDKRCMSLPRSHYRLVTEVAGFALSTLTGTDELLSATFDVLIAMLDAYSKANAFHRDPSIGNIILYRIPDKAIRVGYLIDWELSCKVDKVGERAHVLTGTPAFMSIKACSRGIDHVHGLKDDLESILYVVLYCALRWLPVDTSLGLDWWLNSFFAIYKSGLGGSDKALNAVERTWTKSLTTTGSRDILDWLNAAMDLHHHVEKGPDPARPNPAWDNGKALEAMWKETLANELPHDDRRENPIPT